MSLKEEQYFRNSCLLWSLIIPCWTWSLRLPSNSGNSMILCFPLLDDNVMLLRIKLWFYTVNATLFFKLLSIRKKQQHAVFVTNRRKKGKGKPPHKTVLLMAKGEETVKLPTNLHNHSAESEGEQEPYVLARWAEPFSIRDYHQRRAKASCMVSTVTGVA